MSDIHISKGNLKINTKGIKETNRALRKAGKDSTELSDLMHRIGMLVVDRAKVPVRSGRLRDTLRAGKGKTKAVVRAGYATVPYAGVIHYGWPAHHIRANPFLTDAIDAERGAIISELERGIKDIIRHNKL